MHFSFGSVAKKSMPPKGPQKTLGGHIGNFRIPLLAALLGKSSFTVAGILLFSVYLPIPTAGSSTVNRGHAHHARSGVAVSGKDALAAAVVPSETAAHETTTVRASSNNER
jgi:hypothetical protein